MCSSKFSRLIIKFSESLFSASIIALLQIYFMSPPVSPSVDSASSAKFMSESNGLFSSESLKISSRSLVSGTEIFMRKSNTEGMNKLLSSPRGLSVAAMTVTPPVSAIESISVINCPLRV